MSQRLRIRRRKDGKAKGVRYRTNKKVSVRVGKRTVVLSRKKKRIRKVKTPRLRKRR